MKKKCVLCGKEYDNQGVYIGYNLYCEKCNEKLDEFIEKGFVLENHKIRKYEHVDTQGL